MKKCKACGAVQKDERTTCIDCGEVLGAPMTEAEAEALEDALDDKLYAMSERADDFHVPLWHKILAGVLAACIIASAILLKLCAPDLDATATPAFFGIFFSIFAIPMLIFPKLMWQLETLRYRLWFDNFELSPTYFSIMISRICGYISAFVGILGTAYSYYLYFR